MDTLVNLGWVSTDPSWDLGSINVLHSVSGNLSSVFFHPLLPTLVSDTAVLKSRTELGEKLRLFIVFLVHF